MSQQMLTSQQTIGVATPWTGNYIGKTNAQLGGTTYLQTTGAWAQTIQSIDSKYKIDIRANMTEYMQEETPLLTMLMNLPQGPNPGAPYFVWNDEYKGTSWFDSGLDNLRLIDNVGAAWVGGNSYWVDNVNGSTEAFDGTAPYAVDSSSYVGGMLKFIGNVTVPVYTSATAVTAGTITASAANTNSATLVSSVAKFAITQSTSLQGHVNTVWNQLRQRLSAVGYKTEDGTQSTTSVGKVSYVEGAYCLPVFMAFDSLVVIASDNASYKVLYEVLGRVKEAYYENVNGTISIYFVVDFAASNLSGSIGSTDTILLGPGHNKTQGSPAVLIKDLTNISRMMFMGMSMKAAGPIPEGDKYTRGGGVTSYREAKTNYCQIFRSDAYGITGTHQASQFRFGDDFAETRAHHMMMYKRQKNATYLFGIKGETQIKSADGFMNGQPARATGGLLDYALFPINYIYAPLALRSWADSNPNTFISVMEDHLEKIGERIMAFRHGGAKSITLLCSTKKLRNLTKYNRILQNATNFQGGVVQRSEASQMNFGLENWQYTTARGFRINFVLEPALDYMTEWKVPYFMFGTGTVSPQDIMLCIDTANIAEVVLRNDKIEGNIQDVGQDAFLEGMIGESGFMLRYPKNHSIVYSPEL